MWETATFWSVSLWLPTQRSIRRKEKQREKGKVEHNYIPVFCLDIDLIWLKNVNSDAN